jgi:hypothetical protein
MKKIFSIIVSSFVVLFGFSVPSFRMMPISYKDGNFMGIKILDSMVVENSMIDSIRLFGLSGLAYDNEDDILYSISDRGSLFKFKLILKDNKIISLKPLSAKKLMAKHNRTFLKPYRDSEGLAIVGKGENKHLLISYEWKHRVSQFTLNGIEISSILLPKPLKVYRYYKNNNSSLESVTYHPKYGFITSPEEPLRVQKNGYHGIYNRDGEICKIRKLNKKNSITSIEVMKDNNLLVLLRSFNMMKFEFDITLKKVYLDNISDGVCKSKDLAVMKSKDGWNLDNFEGLTKYKDNQYLMISDDNGNFLQSTILTLFEIKES